MARPSLSYVLRCALLPVFAVACTTSEPEKLSDPGAQSAAPTASSNAAPADGGTRDASADAPRSDATLGDASSDATRAADSRTAPDTSLPPPPQGDPCANVVCPAGQACVSEAHGQPLGVCVDTCDCSNCGNCAYDNADGRWDDMQEYCGNLKSSPATMACNKPCQSAGSGCIYYGAVNICWPLEGCFSL
jgi:hypothetical protein